MSFCKQFNNDKAGKESPVADLAAAMRLLLRRSVDAGSPSSSRSAPSSPRRDPSSSSVHRTKTSFPRGFEAPLWSSLLGLSLISALFGLLCGLILARTQTVGFAAAITNLNDLFGRLCFANENPQKEEACGVSKRRAQGKHNNYWQSSFLTIWLFFNPWRGLTCY